MAKIVDRKYSGRSADIFEKEKERHSTKSSFFSGKSIFSSSPRSRKSKRIVSLDSSEYGKISANKSKESSIRSHSTGENAAQVMHRLNFESIDLGNTPLSSLRSCSEFNKFDYNQQVKAEKEAPVKKSFFSRLFGRKSSKVNDNRRSSISTKEIDEERLFMISQLRNRHTSEFDFPELTPSLTGEMRGYSFSRPPSSRSENSSSFSSRFASFSQKKKKPKRGFSQNVFSEATNAFDVMLGIRSGSRRMPMEIELQDLKHRKRNASIESLVDDRLSIIGDTSDRMSFRRRRDSFAGELDFIVNYNSSTNTVNSNSSNTILGSQASLNTPSDLSSEERRLSLVEVALQAWNYNLKIVSNFGKKYFLDSNEEFLYETIRLQPFTSGAYLRGLLVTGYISTFLCIYSLALWPIFEFQTSFTSQFFERFLLFLLCLQLLGNLMQAPLRLAIHYVCWQSSKAADVHGAIAILRQLLREDYWTANRTIGRLLDSVALFLMIFSELYLWCTSSSDALRSLIVSLVSNNILIFCVRAIIATLYSITMHDPQVLLEARRRGLSPLDIDNLPTFVFSQSDEVNNSDCPICLCSFDLGEMLISLPCDKKHSFHAGCIRQWLERQNACPLCQKMV